MSIWLTHTPPLAQTPDSLSHIATPQEPDTQAVQHADTAGADVPHREVETADTAHAAHPPRPATAQTAPAQADTIQTPVASAPADSLQVPMILPAQADSTTGSDSIISAMLHFQELMEATLPTALTGIPNCLHARWDSAARHCPTG